MTRAAQSHDAANSCWSEQLDRIDRHLVAWMAQHAVVTSRVALGLVFLWFGVLKFVPGLSAADGLATQTMAALSFGVLDASVSRPLLAVWECVIGLGLITGVFLRGALILMGLQMLGTFTPLLLFPGDTWRYTLLVPTLEGQYIIKNIVLISSGLVIGATLRGARLSSRSASDDCQPVVRGPS